jgi:DHA1 family bicyclomycin/chloramphenicol resistance-like MFS transporter
MAHSRGDRFLDRTTPAHIATLVCLTAVASMNMNVFLPSLPGMAEYFDAPYPVLQLSVSAYLLGSALLQVIAGPLSDKFGRRPIILWGFGIFIVATIGCALAPTVEVFLGFRMMQAAVVVGMAISRASIRDTLPPAKAASLIGYVTMGMAIAPMFAPMFGGFLDELFGWQATFVFLALLGVATFVLTWFDLGETAAKTDNSVFQQFKEYPSLLKSRRFWAYSMTLAFATGSYFAFLGGGPFVGSVIYGLSPTALGLAFAAPALGYAAGNFLAGRYSVRVGLSRMINLGISTVMFGLGAVIIAFYLGFNSVTVFFVSMVFVGLGNGMTIPNATSAMLSVRPELAGSASGLGGALMIGGGASLTAYAGTMLDAEAGALPLLWLMFASAAISAVLALYAKSRTDRLEGS